jgi:hypothetical protein
VYVEIDGGVAFDDPRVPARFRECLRRPCAVCGGASTVVGVFLVGDELNALLATPPGSDHVMAVPLCRWCAGPDRARMEAAVEGFIAREVAERLGAN